MMTKSKNVGLANRDCQGQRVVPVLSAIVLLLPCGCRDRDSVDRRQEREGDTAATRTSRLKGELHYLTWPDYNGHLDPSFSNADCADIVLDGVKVGEGPQGFLRALELLKKMGVGPDSKLVVYPVGAVWIDGKMVIDFSDKPGPPKHRLDADRLYRDAWDQLKRLASETGMTVVGALHRRDGPQGEMFPPPDVPKVVTPENSSR